LPNFLRLSLVKAAHAAAGECRVAGNPGSLVWLDQDLGVSIPLRPLLRSNAWMREPRLRSEPISERTSSTRGAGGGALRSCTLRASSADTATGPAGTNPLSAAGDLDLSACSCRRSSRRRGGTTRTCGSLAGSGGAGTAARACGGIAAGAAATAGCLGFFAETFVFTFRVGTFLKSLSGAARMSRARRRRSISASS
jgi:hypothetical protein